MALNGIDVSSYQAGIDMAAVPGSFAIVKATGGTSYVNPACDQQFQSARSAGKKTGVYHFAHEVGCSGSAVDEANFFVANITGYLDGNTMLVLDYESDNQFDTSWALAWLNRVHELTGVKPMIYLNGAALKGADWSAVFGADYGLWLAWYAVSTPTQGYSDYSGQQAMNVTPPYPCAMWQFTSTAQLPGWSGSLDASVFYGDEAAWDAYCRPSGATVAPAPAPVAAPAPKPAPAPAVVGQCTVTPGDTVSGIAAQVGVSLAAIEAVNPGIDYNRIDVGQLLNLPVGANLAALSGAPAPAAPAPVSQCIVSPGDTLSGIAAQFGVSLAAIEAANPGINPDLIYPGQVLNL